YATPPWVLALAWALLCSSARADTVVSVGDTAANGGAHGVVVSLQLASSDDVSMLRFDLRFDATLCDRLASPDRIVVRRAGRLTKNHEEEPIACADGSLKITVLDLLGGVIAPLGTGPILEVVLGDLKPTAVGTFHLTPEHIIARNGPKTLPVHGVTGQLQVS